MTAIVDVNHFTLFGWNRLFDCFANVGADLLHIGDAFCLEDVFAIFKNKIKSIKNNLKRS